MRSLRLLRQGLSVGRGILSFNPIKRIESLEYLLSYLMNRQPPEVIHKHILRAPDLTRAHMPNARLYPVREDMLELLPKGGVCAEVGTLHGAFSQRIAAVCQPDEFHLFDIDFSPLQEDKIRAVLKGNLHKHEGDSSTSLRQMPANFFDWLYIDALHTYEAVVKDLAAAHPTLKPGGYMMCNDYTNFDSTSASPYGVAKAVNEFVLAENYEVVGLALQGCGFYDMLIRKPAA